MTHVLHVLGVLSRAQPCCFGLLRLDFERIQEESRTQVDGSSGCRGGTKIFLLCVNRAKSSKLIAFRAKREEQVGYMVTESGLLTLKRLHYLEAQQARSNPLKEAVSGRIKPGMIEIDCTNLQFEVLSEQSQVALWT